MDTLPSTSKMASFDTKLEHLVKRIMKYNLADSLAWCISDYGVRKFEHFHSIDLDEIDKLTFTIGTIKAEKITPIDAKALCKAVIYALHKEEQGDVDCDDPVQWVVREYQRWSRNRPAAYLL
jgi:hypothetical protein